MMKTQMKHDSNVMSILFKISLLVLPVSILICVFLGTVVGIDHGWAMPAWSDGSKMYGMEAIVSYILIFGIIFRWVYILNFIFQIWYIFRRVIRVSIRKTNNCD